MRSVVALAFLLVAATAGAADDGRTPRPVIERAAKGARCVGDADFMRRNHMDLLKHQRDGSVRQGIRGAAYSLKACVECHASRETGSVTRASTNFCVSCHEYAAVKIDCFECHATQPKAAAMQAPAPARPSAAGAVRVVQGAAR